MIKSIRLCFLSAFIIGLFSACVSAANISEELSPAELIQRAQEASDKNRYNTALQYYQVLHERNRSNIDLIITAEYEIAFIHYKQKKYNQAKSGLNAVLDYYNTPDEELLPQHFKRLARIVLERIDEKQNRLSPFAKSTKPQEQEQEE
jgi:outer membrane protein assembly factor BamD (BamD/ComL family)